MAERRDVIVCGDSRRQVVDDRGRPRRLLLLLGFLAFLPATAHAQSAFSGVVRDASGAVLPGVTVEASSPVLIEKVRSVVTDDAGRYTIVDLRPGTYKLTFTLAGFSTLVRDAVELPGNTTVPINVELRVGLARREPHGVGPDAARRRPERAAHAGASSATSSTRCRPRATCSRSARSSPA